MDDDVRFPLEGVDGWYPHDTCCAVCRKSLAKPKERLRLYVGTTLDAPTTPNGVHFDLHLYGGTSNNDTEHGMRTVNVLRRNDDPEAVIEICSTACLRRLFDSIVKRLE